MPQRLVSEDIESHPLLYWGFFHDDSLRFWHASRRRIVTAGYGEKECEQGAPSNPSKQGCLDAVYFGGVVLVSHSLLVFIGVDVLGVRTGFHMKKRPLAMGAIKDIGPRMTRARNGAQSHPIRHVTAFLARDLARTDEVRTRLDRQPLPALSRFSFHRLLVRAGLPALSRSRAVSILGICSGEIINPCLYPHCSPPPHCALLQSQKRPASDCGPLCRSAC